MARYRPPRAGKGSTYHQRYRQQRTERPEVSALDPRVTRKVEDPPLVVPRRELAWAARIPLTPIPCAPTSALYRAVGPALLCLANGWVTNRKGHATDL